MAKRRALAVFAAWGFYLIIVLEFLYMISPLALYFYSAYGPALNLLHRSPSTAWLTAFFLPHFSQTSSLLLNELHEVGELVALSGLLIFGIGAAQIYWAKIRRKNAVTRRSLRIHSPSAVLRPGSPGIRNHVDLASFPGARVLPHYAVPLCFVDWLGTVRFRMAYLY